MRHAVPLALLLTLSLTACPKKQDTQPEPPADDGGVMCTMDAKMCPDGSAVGRQGPNCEFAPCPGETGEGEAESDEAGSDEAESETPEAESE